MVGAYVCGWSIVGGAGRGGAGRGLLGLRFYEGDVQEEAHKIFALFLQEVRLPVGGIVIKPSVY